MIQSPMLAGSPRPAGVADAPDVMFVVRRYIWLILIGTVFCTLCAAALWYYLYRTQPWYTARVTFQVLPPPAPPGASTANWQATDASQEEITRFMQRQAEYIMRPEVLQAAIDSDAFQHDPKDPTKKSRWLSEGVATAMDRLKQDLSVTTKPQAELFEISMMAHDPAEAAALVNGVAQVYLDNLRSDTASNQRQRVEQLRQVVQKQQNDVDTAKTELTNFQTGNNIDAVVQRYQPQIAVLADLNSKYLMTEGQAQSAEQQLKKIKDDLASGTLELSPDAKLFVDNNPELRMLEQQKLQLEQDLVVALMDKSAMGDRSVQAAEARMRKVDEQTQQKRREVESEARVSMEQTAEQVANQLAQLAQYLKTERDKKDNEIKSLDLLLVKSQGLTEDLKNKQMILEDVQKQHSLANLESDTDDSRVRRFGLAAIPPDKVSWPMWYWFIPAGFVAGIGMSFGAAYLFELTNTRVRTPRDVTKTLQLPLLGFIPDQDDDSALTGDLSTSIRTAPGSMIAESFRQIRGRLIAEADGRAMKSLLVASVAPGGGATTVASNVANGMALNELRVLLVDANFYRPGLRHCYKNLPAVGLSDVVLSPEKLDEAIVPSTEVSLLHVMGAGSVGGTNPAEMFESKAFKDVLETLKSRYDLIVFDGAPLSLVSDSVALGARVDGVIAVVRAGEVSRGTVARVREQLRQVKANFLGVVLNAAQTHGAGYFKENYRTFYEYAGQASRTNGAAVH